MSRVRIKICGITQAEQAVAIANLGVDAVGFVLFKSSERYVAPKVVSEIVHTVPTFVTTVAVVVNESVERVRELYDATHVDLLQLHGDETPEYCAELDRIGIPWIKAFRVNAQFDLKSLARYPKKDFLFDAWSDAGFGGTGVTFDWSQLAGVALDQVNVILAGGLSAENVKAAIHTVRPYAVDVSSGVEVSPGLKDLRKVEQLVQMVDTATA